MLTPLSVVTGCKEIPNLYRILTSFVASKMEILNWLDASVGVNGT
jgi:hypothetical protein